MDENVEFIMSKPVVFLPKADDDLDNNYLYIRQNNPSAAVRLLDAVQETVEQISKFPLIGKNNFAELNFPENVRVFVVLKFHKLLIFYIDQPKHIEVLRILHGSMDISEELLWE